MDDAQTRIRLALKRTAILQLKTIVGKEVQERVEATSNNCVDQDGLLKDILNAPSINSQTIRDLVIIIYGCNYQLMLSQEPSLPPSTSQKVAKDQTKQIITNIIKNEVNSLQDDVLSSCNQNLQKKLEEKDGNQNISPLASMSPSVLEEVFSPHHDVYQSESLAIQSFPEAMMEEVGERQYQSQQQWRQTKEQALHSGHFLRGDKIANIRKLIIFSGQICGVIEWNKRGVQTPRQSIMEIGTIREHAPRELATFLEKVATLHEG